MSGPMYAHSDLVLTLSPRVLGDVATSKPDPIGEASSNRAHTVEHLVRTLEDYMAARSRSGVSFAKFLAWPEEEGAHRQRS